MTKLWNSKLSLSLGGGYYKSLLASLGFLFLSTIWSISFLSGLFGLTSNNSAYADTNSGSQSIGAEIIRVAFGLSISVEPSVTLNVKPTPTGAMTIGSSTVTAATSSTSGYALYLQMTGDNSSTNALINNVDESATITSSGTFFSPTALTSGTWGYAIPHDTPSVLSSNGFDVSYTVAESIAPTTNKFASVPTTSNNPQKIAETSTPGGIDLPVYYGVMASYDTISGSYSNKVLYTALADDASMDRIAVAPSTVDVNTKVDNFLVATALYSTSESANASIYLLTEAEYNSISGTNVEALGISPLSCTETDATPHSYICSLPAITSLGTYYIYVKYPSYDRVYSTTLTVRSAHPIMQDFTIAECNVMSIGDTISLQDSRDWSSYTVAKLADGNCWMTQNLRLGSSAGSIRLTPDDSNVSRAWILPAAQATSDTTTSWGDAANTSNTPHLYATGNDSYGNYYNWYAATAGTGLGTMSSASATNLTNATDSICPKGWRLPDGGQSTNKSFYQLDRALGGNGANRTDATQLAKYLDTPYNFSYSGYYSYSGALNQGADGHWWTRSAYLSSTQAHNFYIQKDGDYVYPQHANHVGYGFSMRCVQSTGISDLMTMQQMTPGIASAMSVNETKSLIDKRDNNSYTVKKLKDGKVWMTQNLRLQNVEINYADSNLPPNQTIVIPASDSAIWCTDDNSACENQLMTLDSGNSSYGVYYNWHTATASYGTHEMSSGDVRNSICPKGWRLPSGDSNGEFSALYGQYGSSALMRGDPAFVLSGYRYGSNTYSQGSDGDYWSATAQSESFANHLYLLGTSVEPSYVSYKWVGMAVRCLAQ